MSNILNYNPFRTPRLTPQNTNNSVAFRSPGGIDTLQTATIQQTPLHDVIPDEDPPPYTPSADISRGEISVEVNPTRPFQSFQGREQVPSPGTQPVIRVNDGSPTPRSVPPPLPPRDFPITRLSRETFLPPHSPVSSRPERPTNTYLPPPGPPPIPDGGSSALYDPPLGSPPRRHVSVPSRPIDTRQLDDGRPTTTPVPGHPLLLKNKLLVYPSGYECSQCKNVGYKNNDPSHPCTKCWNKYARSYSGALAYAPFPSQSGSGGSGSGSSNFQRPLPKLQAPHTHTYNASSSHSRSPTATQKPPEQARLRRRSDSRLNVPQNNHTRNVSSPALSPRINTSNAPVRPGIPTRPSFMSLPQAAPNSLSTGRRSSFISTSPPAQTPSTQPVVFQAGDPRIGGSLCWRCDGRGYVSYFFLDTSTCEVCNGIGRTFR